MRNGANHVDRRLLHLEKVYEEDRKRWAMLARYIRSNEARWRREEERWRRNEEHDRKTDERIEKLYRLLYRKLEG